MKVSKHDIRKGEILESAFRIWGGCRYVNTSLADLAAELKLTKQAIYRYFPSKELLEQAMEDTALDAYRIHTESLIKTLSDADRDEFVRIYVNGNVDFITRNAELMGFLAYRYRQESDGPLIARSQMAVFSSLAWNRAGIPETALRYLNALSFVIVHNSAAGEEFTADWHGAWLDGFAAGGLTGRPDFDRMLSDAAMVDYGAFARDTLMSAVFETVMEEAGGDISLGKVARRAGLTKSSLYNYWPGKEAMLTDVLRRQALLFIDLFGQFAGRYENPEDRIFAYLAFTGTFLRRNPDILNYMQRMMSLGVRMPREEAAVDPKFFAPMYTVLNLGLLNLHGFTPADFIGLVSLAGVTEIKHHLGEKSPRIRIDQGLKDLYLLITGGIAALRRTM